MKIHSFDPVEWWRALWPYMCRCGHSSSAHERLRARCSRPDCSCVRARKMTLHGAVLFGYRLGRAAERATGRLTVLYVFPDEPETPPSPVDPPMPTGQAFIDAYSTPELRGDLDVGWTWSALYRALRGRNGAP